LDNLVQINSAYQQYFLEARTKDIPAIDSKTIGNYFQAGHIPSCPGGGVYSSPSGATEFPKCTVPGHSLK
jgi:hypothetical protein